MRYLEAAQNLDFDDAVEDERKFVQAKWKRYQDIRVQQRLQKEKKAQKAREKEIKRRRAAIKKAQEEQVN